jgi:hypothetical protein
MTTHRSFTPEFKVRAVLEVLTGVRSASTGLHGAEPRKEF